MARGLPRSCCDARHGNPPGTRYVQIDDRIGGRRRTDRPSALSDSEPVCLAAAQPLLGHHRQARWLRYARKNLAGMFPHLPGQSGCNRRLKSALPPVKTMTRTLARAMTGHWPPTATCPPAGTGYPRSRTGVRGPRFADRGSRTGRSRTSSPSTGSRCRARGSYGCQAVAGRSLMAEDRGQPRRDREAVVGRSSGWPTP